jgi:hypothetical protein
MASQEQLRLREQIMMQARNQQMLMMAAGQQNSAMGMQHQQNDPDQLRLQIQAQQMQARQMQARQMQARQMQAQQVQRQQMQPQGRTMGTAYDDVPITQLSDQRFFGKNPLLIVGTPSSNLSPYELACRNGPLSAIQSAMASEETPTPAFLNHGLIFAIGAGNVEAARHLLDSSAPILRLTPELILRAPQDKQIALFDLLISHGWSPTKPGPDGTGLLARVVTNIPLLKWFLAHGANPNIGVDGTGEPDPASCAALEAAAIGGSSEAVKILLEAGAQIGNGTPLHHAAGACPPGANPHAGRVSPSKEFDAGRIPIMELLVEGGAGVNQRAESRHMTPQYPIVHAVMAGAVERTKWLLSRGANPSLKGAFGTAAEYARLLGSDEMKAAIEEGIAARKWMETADENEQKD